MSMRPLILLLSALVLGGCSLLDPWTFDGYQRELEGLLDEIDEAAGSARAEAASACRVVAFGHKACGGPTQYRVYSETDGDPERVRRLADEYTEVERRMVDRLGLGSTCDVLYVPPVMLEDGRCRAATP